MTCSNCTNAAVYKYDITVEHSVAYCDACLPGFLRPRAKAGNLPLLQARPVQVVEAQAALSPEVPHAPEPTPAPAPKKRAKKAAAPAE